MYLCPNIYICIYSKLIHIYICIHVIYIHIFMCLCVQYQLGSLDNDVFNYIMTKIQVDEMQFTMESINTILLMKLLVEN
jgi:hypothetical protein